MPNHTKAFILTRYHLLQPQSHRKDHLENSQSLRQFQKDQLEHLYDWKGKTIYYARICTNDKCKHVSENMQQYHNEHQQNTHLQG